MIEVVDLLTQDEVFQQDGAARVGFEGVFVVRNHRALVGGQCAEIASGIPVQFTSGARSVW
jgi:hypothetical protein